MTTKPLLYKNRIYHLATLTMSVSEPESARRYVMDLVENCQESLVLKDDDQEVRCDHVIRWLPIQAHRSNKHDEQNAATRAKRQKRNCRSEATGSDPLSPSSLVPVMFHQVLETGLLDFLSLQDICKLRRVDKTLQEDIDCMLENHTIAHFRPRRISCMLSMLFCLHHGTATVDGAGLSSWHSWPLRTKSMPIADH